MLPECPQHWVGIEPGARQQCYSSTRCVTGALLGSERRPKGTRRAAAADGMTLSNPSCYLAPRRMRAAGAPPCGAEPVSVYEGSAHKSAPHDSRLPSKGGCMLAHVNTPNSVVWERYIAIDLHKHYLMVAGIN